MPSLREIAHDGVLCTFSNKSAPDRGKWCGPSRQAAMDRPSRTNSHSAGSLSSSQPGGPPCWTSPLAFGLTGQNYLYIHQSYCKNCRIFPCMKIHIMVCMVIIILLNWWWIYAILCHGPLLFFPRIFPEVSSGIFFSQADFRPPAPPLFFNEFVFVDPVPDPRDKMAPKKK